MACDYAFLSAGPTAAEAGDEASEQGLPVLVHKLYGDRWVTAHVVPRKGPDPWAVRVAASDLEASGLSSFLYKSDGESAILALKRRVTEELRGRVGPQLRVQHIEAGVGESQQNSVVERAIWEAQGVARTLMHAVRVQQGTDIPLAHPLRVWAVEYAAQLLNRAQRAAHDHFSI